MGLLARYRALRVPQCQSQEIPTKLSHSSGSNSVTREAFAQHRTQLTSCEAHSHTHNMEHNMDSILGHFMWLIFQDVLLNVESAALVDWILVPSASKWRHHRQHRIWSNTISASHQTELPPRIFYRLYLILGSVWKRRARKGCRWLKRMQELLGSDARNLSGRSSTCQNYKNKCTDQRSWKQGWNQEKLMMKARWQWWRRVILKINIQVGLEVFRWARRLV